MEGVLVWKKQSPSTQRRNLRRRNEFLASKEAKSPAKVNLNGDDKHDEEALETKTRECKHVENPAMSRDICGDTTKTENGLKHHKNKEHELPEQSYELPCNIYEYESETEDGMKTS